MKFRNCLKPPPKTLLVTCKTAAATEHSWKRKKRCAQRHPKSQSPLPAQPGEEQQVSYAGRGEDAGEGRALCREQGCCWEQGCCRSRDAHGGGCLPGLPCCSGMRGGDGRREGVSSPPSATCFRCPRLVRSLPNTFHRKMDYSTVRLMGFHFAKHLSLLVLDSEREISFDCRKATSVCNM